MTSYPKPPLLGMVCAGPVSRSFTGMHPRVLERLGPVKAASLRVASRAVNSMDAGTPVATFEQLQPARIIIVNAPDTASPAILRDLAASALDWKRKTVALADSAYDCHLLAPLAAAGAAVTTFNALPQFENRKYLIEGDEFAVGAMRKLLDTDVCRGLAIERGSKSRVLLSLAILDLAVKSMLASGSRTFRSAGMRPADAQGLLECTAVDAIRTHLKAGQNAVANLDLSMLPYHMERLEEADAAAEDWHYYKELLAAIRYKLQASS